jgi:hypothetical protein
LHELDVNQLEAVSGDEVQTHVHLEHESRSSCQSDEHCVSMEAHPPYSYKENCTCKTKELTRGSSREAMSRVSE